MELPLNNNPPSATLEPRSPGRSQPGAATADRPPSHPPCAHCGLPCPPRLSRTARGHLFCCAGCATVHQILTENGLGEFYQLDPSAPITTPTPAGTDEFQFLDQPGTREQLVDFSDERLTRVTFNIPSIHCIACVWLLENLFRINPGIGGSRVNFPRKELAVSFETAKVKLSQLVALLKTLGYEPELRLADLDAVAPANQHRFWLQLGVAGFAFGNIMLFSIPSYVGLDSFDGPFFERLFRILNLLLGTLVVTYSARDYWRAAWQSLQKRLLTIEVPIALGILALFGQSAADVLRNSGDGYFDSLSGLLFLLLIGKWFQQRSYDRLAFDRDYRSFFPLAVTRLNHQHQEERVALSELRTGDRLRLRNGDLIPADATLTSPAALIDYSFVTGESNPVSRHHSDPLYAGGRQVGESIEIRIVKPVRQSYLTSLWNQETFQQSRDDSFESITNRYGRRFTRIVIGIAFATALYWAIHNPALAIPSFTAVLIVACPCALALAAPFALGSAQRVLARNNIFLKNSTTIERLASITRIVFDKTGTLTTADNAVARFHGRPLTPREEQQILTVARHSTHPRASRIAGSFSHHLPETAAGFAEIPGAGIRGIVEGTPIHIGSLQWLQSHQIPLPTQDTPREAATHLAINHHYRGCFTVSDRIRPGTRSLARQLSTRFRLALLSGDQATESARFQRVFGPATPLHFNQRPEDKLRFIQQARQAGDSVMMVGDGLNDAGALQESNVGVAVVEDLSAFSPASDVILPGPLVPRLNDILRFARQSVRVVRASLVISALYNVIGITIAAQGLLSPVICAILMPLSSVTVVAFACGLTNWHGRRLQKQPLPQTPALAGGRPS